MSDRSTADLVILIVTLLVAVAILMAGAGIFLLALLNPNYPMTEAFAVFGQVVGLLIGSVLGFLAGKGRSVPTPQ